MNDDEMPVNGHLHVKFQIICTAGDGVAEGCQSIFRSSYFSTAMGNELGGGGKGATKKKIRAIVDYEQGKECEQKATSAR